MLFFKFRTMRLHWGYHFGKIWYYIGEMLLYQEIYGMAAGRNDNILLFTVNYSVVLVLYYCGSDRRFFNAGKAERHKCFFHRGKRHVVIGNKRRRKANIDLAVTGQQFLCLIDIVAYDFGILRTRNKAHTAENTLILNDLRLIGRKTDRFDRTIPDTFIAVFTV